MNNNLSFNHELHNKTKRLWIVTYGALISIGILFYISAYLFKLKTSVSLAYPGYFGLMTLSCIVSALTTFFMYYHCVYKKNGTKLLLLNIIFTPLALIYFMALIKFGSPTFAESLLYMVSIPMNAYLWYVSYELFKLNKAKKAIN